MANTEPRDFVTDAPIDDASQDRFNRAPFAAQIARTIAAQRDPASLVVGLYGPWGDGKTSVLNLVERALSGFSDVIPVRFNPWQLGDESLVFRGFFETLAEALDANLLGAKERVGSLLTQYGGLLEPIPIAGSVASKVARATGQALSATSLGKLRGRIEKILSKSGKRVVILIDDLDRLDKSEIQTIFRLVKVAADFAHTAYVLAFDDEAVSAALAERYASGSAHGTNFLEKIIQLPLHLPPVSDEMLRLVTLETVDVALDQANVELSQPEVNRFASVFQRAVTASLKTPRVGKRYGNAILFALPMIGTEVNPVDLLLIEAMRIFFSPLYEWVRSHDDEALGHTLQGNLADAAKAIIKSGFEDATKELPAAEVRGAQTLLTSLFPRTESVWQNKHWPAEWEATWARQKRIASPQYFHRYFTYSIPVGDVPDTDVDRLIGVLETPAPDASDAMPLAQGMLAGGGEAFITKLAGRLDDPSPELAAHTALLLASVAAAFSDRSDYLGRSTMQRAARLMSKMFARVRPEDRFELAKTLVSSDESLPFTIEVFRWLGAANGSVLSPEQANVLGALLAARISDLWQNDNPFETLGRAVGASLHLWSTYGEAGAVKEHLESRIRGEADAIFALMASFLGQAWSMDTGVPLEPDFRREAYDAISRFVDPALIFATLQEIFGDSVGIGDFYEMEQLPAQERLAHQFGFIHRVAQHDKELRGPGEEASTA
jgi:hypothetical protein